jgi:hypothetical protein
MRIGPAQASRRGHIRAGGVEKDVTCAGNRSRRQRPDRAAYRAKYSRCSGSYVDPTIAPAARDTTFKLLPR